VNFIIEWNRFNKTLDALLIVNNPGTGALFYRNYFLTGAYCNSPGIQTQEGWAPVLPTSFYQSVDYNTASIEVRFDWKQSYLNRYSIHFYCSYQVVEGRPTGIVPIDHVDGTLSPNTVGKVYASVEFYVDPDCNGNFTATVSNDQFTSEFGNQMALAGYAPPSLSRSPTAAITPTKLITGVITGATTPQRTLACNIFCNGECVEDAGDCSSPITPEEKPSVIVDYVTASTKVVPVTVRYTEEISSSYLSLPVTVKQDRRLIQLGSINIPPRTFNVGSQLRLTLIQSGQLDRQIEGLDETANSSLSGIAFNLDLYNKKRMVQVSNLRNSIDFELYAFLSNEMEAHASRLSIYYLERGSTDWKPSDNSSIEESSNSFSDTLVLASS